MIVLVRDAVEIARSAILAKKLNVSTELSAKKHHVLADPIRLQQVFWNLINNAVKFTPPGGQVAIHTFNDARNHFRFEITDNGIGIERERLTSLFIPFEQADPSVTRLFGGLGLGLAITKRLVDLHKGAIEVESRGRSFGSTFRVILDALPEEVTGIEIDAEIGRGRLPQPERALDVVDEESRMRFERDLDPVVAREARGVAPVRDRLLLPLPFEHVEKLRRPWCRHPVGMLRVV